MVGNAKWSSDQPFKLAIKGFEAPAHCHNQPAPAGSRAIHKEVSMAIVVEIRAGEGGADAELLVREQARAYLNKVERRTL